MPIMTRRFLHEIVIEWFTRLCVLGISLAARGRVLQIGRDEAVELAVHHLLHLSRVESGPCVLD